jgi:hypothetical protein
MYLFIIYIHYRTQKRCITLVFSTTKCFCLFSKLCFISFQCVAIIIIFEFCALLSFYHAWNLERFKYETACWVQVSNSFLVSVGTLIHELHLHPKICNKNLYFYWVLLCLERFKYQITCWVQVSNNLFFGKCWSFDSWIAPTSKNMYLKHVSLFSFIMLGRV